MSLEIAHRILALISSGVPVELVKMALDRSTGDDDIGQLIGLLEDLHEVSES